MAALSYKGMERGKCAECGELLYINKETGLCIACENAVFRESITILTVMLSSFFSLTTGYDAFRQRAFEESVRTGKPLPYPR